MRKAMVLMVVVVLLVLAAGRVGAQAADEPVVGGIGPIAQPELSGGWVAGFVYVFLLVLMEYVPGFRDWWDVFKYKYESIAGFGLVVVIALVGLHYAGAFDLEIGAFGWPVIGTAINTWLAFLGGAWLIWTALKKARALPRMREGYFNDRIPYA